MINLKNILEVIINESLSFFTIALILTIFEIILFYMIVVPEIKNNITSHLREVKQELRTKYNVNLDEQIKYNTLINQIPNNGIYQDMNNNLFMDFNSVIEGRETQLLTKINNMTKFAGIMLVMILCGLLVLSAILLKITNRKFHILGLIAALVTVGLIAAFQYNFYLFGKKYQYTGSKGKEEMLAIIIKQLEKKN